jgi:hypothetical protein
LGEATTDGVRLTWRPPDGAGPFRFNVYRAREGEPPEERPVQREPLGTADYLDSDVVSGSVYIYEVRTAVGEGAPLRESVSSPPIRIEASDLFAPAPPTKVVAVQEGPAVRLFWNPNQEKDLAGYRLYRREGGGEWTRLSPDAVDRPSYLDREVSSGRSFSYRVTAVDRATPPNESGPSEEVSVEIAPDPTAGGGQRP